MGTNPSSPTGANRRFGAGCAILALSLLALAPSPMAAEATSRFVSSTSDLCADLDYGFGALAVLLALLALLFLIGGRLSDNLSAKAASWSGFLLIVALVLGLLAYFVPSGLVAWANNPEFTCGVALDGTPNLPFPFPQGGGGAAPAQAPVPPEPLPASNASAGAISG